MSPDPVDRHDRAVLRDILARYADRIDRVGLFGSRATGAARRNSDIDLVVYGRLDAAGIDRLWTLFEDSPLSVSVDVVAYADDLYPPLRRHIDAMSLPLFSHADLVTPAGHSGA